MIRISKIFLFVTLAVLAVWQLPWCYAFLTTKAAPSRFVMYSSLLDDFILTGYTEGVGITRARSLLKHFGTIAAIRRASTEELRAAPGMTRPAAEKVYRALHEDEFEGES